MDHETADVRRPPLSRVPTGVGGLDTILNGGLLRAGLYIIQGLPGSGKTVFGNQACFAHVRNGGRALYVTLLGETHIRMMQHMETMSFFEPRAMPDSLAYLGAFKVLQTEGLGGVARLVRREAQTHRATLLVLDGLISAREAAISELEYKQFIQDLQIQATVTDCTMVLLTTTLGEGVSSEHTMVDGVIDLHDKLYDWRAESSLRVRKLRGSGFLRGEHAYRITDDGIEVFPRVEAVHARPSGHEVPPPDERVPSGIAGLDMLLGGGIPRASTTVVMGPSGSGKTTVGLQFLSQSTPAEPGLLFGFFETPERIAAKAAAVCGPLVPLLRDQTVETIWHPPIDDLLDAYGARLLDAVARRGVRRLVIDGLEGLDKSSVNPARMVYYFTALTNELRARGVSTLYTAEMPDIMGWPTTRTLLGGLPSIAENIVLLRFVEAEARLHRMLSVLKVRDSDFDPGLYRFELTAHGLRIDVDNAAARRILAGAGMRDPDGA